MPKKPNRRNAEKHPNLDAKLNLKTRYDLYECDYQDKLSPKELDWLDKFNKEYIGDDLDRKNLRKNLHRTKKLKKSCDDMNNSRNRDILTRAKASKQLADYEELENESSNNNYEDYIIQELDKQDARKAVDWLAEALNKDEESLESNLIDEGSEKS